MGELARVTEVHSVRRTVDHRDTQVGRRQAADLLYPPQRRHERVASADHGKRAHRRPQHAFERRESHELAEQLQRVHGAEVKIVAKHDRSHPQVFPPHIAGELHESPGEGLVVHSARG